MGRVLAKSGWSRRSYVVSTKFFWGIHGGVNVENTLNRKYLLQAMDDSLGRLQLDFVDLVFCHRPDPETDLEETVWAMHDLVSRGKALYWGTSEWPAADIRAAFDIAERHHLHKPLMEQPEYNLFTRQRVEIEYQRLYQDCGLGLTTWSPLASGVLTGKYINGIPKGSRGRCRATSGCTRTLPMVLGMHLSADLSRWRMSWVAPRHSLRSPGARTILESQLSSPELPAWHRWKRTWTRSR